MINFAPLATFLNTLGGRMRPWLFGIALLAFSLLLLQCGGTPERKPLSRGPETQEPRQETQPTPAQSTTSRATPTPQAPSAPRADQYGWLITQAQTLQDEQVVSLAQQAGVTHFQIGGSILESVDDLLFNTSLQTQVDRFAQRAEAVGIDVYLWSRELNLDGAPFRFHEADPFTYARQAAYRNVLSQLPEIDGIVLRLTDAPSPPWETNIPDDAVALPPHERVRFVLEMIHEAVVVESGRQLRVAMPPSGENAASWLREAVSGLPQARFALQFQAEPEIGKDPRLLNQHAGSYRNDKNLWLGFDAVGARQGGPALLSSVSLAVQAWSPLLQEGQINGMVARVDCPTGTLFGTPNALNLAVIKALLAPKAFDEATVVEGQLMDRYEIAPGTRESVMLQTLMQQAASWSWKSARVNGARFASLIPPATQTSAPRYEMPAIGSDALSAAYVQRIAQENSEAMEQVKNAQQQLDAIRTALAPDLYRSFAERLRLQAQWMKVLDALQQIRFGLAVWKNSYHEGEAQVLEANLQRLARLAQENEWDDLCWGDQQVTASRLQEFTEAVREQFPRLLLGFQERSWNRIQGIEVRRTGPDRVELVWQTEQASTSAASVGLSVDAVDRTIRASTFPEFEHRCQFGDLQPGRLYFFRLQCRAENGALTQSGLIPFYLKPTPVL